MTVRKKGAWAASAASHAVLLAFSLFSLFPVLWVVSLALDPHGEARPTSLHLIPSGISFDAFAKVIANPTEVDGISFWGLLANSLALAGGTTLIGVGLGATAAYAFSRLRFPGRKAGLLAFILLQAFPTVVTLAPLYVLLSVLHLRTSLVGLAIAYAAGALPFAIWNLKGYFDTVPKDLEEAAMIDGCSRTAAFWKVVLPLATPSIAVTALYAFMASWTEIIMAWTMLEDPRRFTLAMALYGMVGQYGSFKPWNQFAALSLIISLPVVVLMLVLQKFIVGGLTSGGVKG